MTAGARQSDPLSGRIDAVPAQVWHDEVLAPQFAADVAHLLPWYIAVEKVLLLEYARMGVLDAGSVATLATRLHALRAADLVADPESNMSDLAFAIERHVGGGAARPVPAWRVDRSRNDLQACAQLMAARIQVIAVADAVHRFATAVLGAARETVEMPMPGYTHLQPAQVITPGFYLSAILAEALDGLHRLDVTYGQMDRCPLGAGALCGQQLPWDRARMARLLGFREVEPHALNAVASRAWALAFAADLGVLGVTLGRLATDLMSWASGWYGFLDLPDELTGISSAMPQKRNFPVLERIRGRSGHLTAGFGAIAAGQRAAPYTNMVEVAKEANAALPGLVDTAVSTLRLVTVVVQRLRFLPGPMREACQRDYLGGFTLANLLTLRSGVPWRAAQVVAGRYITAAIGHGRPATQPDPALLTEVAATAGHRVEAPALLLAEAFDVDRALRAKRTTGSAHPTEVRRLLQSQQSTMDSSGRLWRIRHAAGTAILSEVDIELGLFARTDKGEAR
jgi:argininosuccinate lyase